MSFFSRKKEVPWRIAVHTVDLSEKIEDTDGPLDKFCHGCGASVKHFGPHKCQFCGTALNVRPPEPEAAPLCVAIGYDALAYGTLLPLYETGEMAIKSYMGRSH